VETIDTLCELLTPTRRPQDRDEPECSRTELRILAALGRMQPLTMTALAGALRIPLSTATRAVDKLVAKRFVERGRSPRDRRLVHVVFSPRGRRINLYVSRTRAALASKLLGRLGSAELARMVALLTRLTAR